jgi:ribosomal protein L37AE/L43A
LSSYFQKGLSEAGFEELYGSEEKCRAVVFAWRWPTGFACPVCGGHTDSEVKTRGLYQCSTCRRQTSLIAGTIFAAMKVPLQTGDAAARHGRLDVVVHDIVVHGSACGAGNRSGIGVHGTVKLRAAGVAGAG